MTHNELRELMITKKNPMLRVGKLAFPVIIADVRQVFGRVDALVSPVQGQGYEWVSLDRLTNQN